MQSGGRPHYPNPYGGGYEGGTSGGGGYNSMGTTAAYYPYGATGGNPHFPYPYDYSSLRDDTIPGGEASQGGTSDRYQEEAADEEGVERQPYSGYSSSEHNAPGAAVGGGPAIMQPQGTYDLTYADLEANEQSGTSPLSLLEPSPLFWRQSGFRLSPRLAQDCSEGGDPEGTPCPYQDHLQRFCYCHRHNLVLLDNPGRS